MKNGYTPKEYAYAIAIDALLYATQNRFGELADLTESEIKIATEAMQKLRHRLADEVKMNIL